MLCTKLSFCMINHFNCLDTYFSFLCLCIAGQYFPMCISKVLSCVKDVVGEWERLGMALQIPYEILREIDIDKSRVSLKKEAMIIKWMDSQGPACWWLLVKALEEIELNVAASDIRAEQGNSNFNS